MTIYEDGNPDADTVLIQLTGDHELSVLENEVWEIRKRTSIDFRFLAAKVDDWNHELSPWKAPAVFGNEDFGDGAARTLEQILSLCTDKSKTYYIGGYSLSGLFSIPWEKYYIRFEEPDCEIVPVGCVLTMVGTGSEMNGGAVITNHDQKMKIGHVFGDTVMPKFAILNPKFTFTLPKEQMVAGIYDIFNHICEQYFSGEDDNTSDYISEALMKSVIHSSRIAIQNPEDYEARSNIMWAATWALNTLVSRGKSTDWMVHMLGQAVGAYTDATHGMTLSAVSLPYYQYIMPYGLSRFCRFAVNVWEVNPAGKSDEQIAREGLSCMEGWMKELGLAMNLHELGVTEEMLDGITNGTIIMEGGYKVLNHDEVLNILKNSL